MAIMKLSKRKLLDLGIGAPDSHSGYLGISVPSLRFFLYEVLRIRSVGTVKMTALEYWGPDET